MNSCTCKNPELFYYAWENKMYEVCSNCNKVPLTPTPILTRYGKKLISAKEAERNNNNGTTENHYDQQWEQQ